MSPSQASPPTTNGSSTVMFSGSKDSYNETAAPQKRAYIPAIPLFPDLSSYSSITIADYGCSLAGNSIAPLTELLKTLPNGATTNIIFNDRTNNDWNEVARTVMAPEAYHDLSRDGKLDVSISMVPRSFYSQVVPSSSVDIGLSWTSFNYIEHAEKFKARTRWGSTSSENTASSPLSSSTSQAPSDSEAEFKAAAAQAHTDLVKLLRLRALEIKPSGTLLCAIVAATDSSPTVEGRLAKSSIMYALSRALLTLQSRSPPLLSKAQAESIELPMHERTREEVARACEEVRDIWNLEAFQGASVPHPAWLRIQHKPQTSRSEDDYEAYAEAVVAWGMGVLTWFVVAALRAHPQQNEAKIDTEGKAEKAGENGVAKSGIGREKDISELEKGILAELRREMKIVLKTECADWPASIEYWYVKLVKKNEGQ